MVFLLRNIQYQKTHKNILHNYRYTFIYRVYTHSLQYNYQIRCMSLKQLFVYIMCTHICSSYMCLMFIYATKIRTEVAATKQQQSDTSLSYILTYSFSENTRLSRALLVRCAMHFTCSAAR